jgi:hypothetical protein
LVIGQDRSIETLHVAALQATSAFQITPDVTFEHGGLYND